MCIRGVLIVFMITFYSSGSVVAQIGELNWDDQEMDFITGEHDLSEILEIHEAVALIFLDPECPNCQKYGATFRALDSAFSSQQVALIGVFPFSSHKKESIQRFVTDYNFQFPQVLDSDNNWVKATGVNTTPEAVLVTKEGNILYRGAVNNWFYDLGQYRRQVTEHYLVNAVHAFLNHKPVKTSETEAIGCLIGRHTH